MGVDLCQYGNHKINFKDRSYEDIAIEIKNKLDNFHPTNEEYMKALKIIWLESFIEDPNDKQVLRDKIIQDIKEIKEKKDWKWNYEIRTDDNYNEILFVGFLGYELSFSTDKIYYHSTPYRFLGWFRSDKIIRDEFRKYMCQLIHLFGGDRTIYLPDGYLETEKYVDYWDCIDSPFEEIERDLINTYGVNTIKLGNFTDEDDVCYYIDTFEDLDLENKMPLDDFIKWANEH